ncbi:hypothetical protein BC829DRAFT_232655 [Chytridium lagenaria]|nr:hypothetical protein BC829DRAFT_232655 [Chytridium lagenaria]
MEALENSRESCPNILFKHGPRNHLVYIALATARFEPQAFFLHRIFFLLFLVTTLLAFNKCVDHEGRRSIRGGLMACGFFCFWRHCRLCIEVKVFRRSGRSRRSDLGMKGVDYRVDGYFLLFLRFDTQDTLGGYVVCVLIYEASYALKSRRNKLQCSVRDFVVCSLIFTEPYVFLFWFTRFYVGFATWDVGLSIRAFEKVDCRGIKYRRYLRI